jgi:hypothetical protein
VIIVVKRKVEIVQKDEELVAAVPPGTEQHFHSIGDAGDCRRGAADIKCRLATALMMLMLTTQLEDRNELKVHRAQDRRHEHRGVILDQAHGARRRSHVNRRRHPGLCSARPAIHHDRVEDKRVFRRQRQEQRCLARSRAA